MCDQSGAGLPERKYRNETREPGDAGTRARHRFDRDTAMMLQVVRCYLHAFAEPQGQGWRHAFPYARSLPHAADLLAALSASVEAMSRSRRSPFQFRNPHCSHCAQGATPHERQFMACVTHARAGRMRQAQRHAVLLCEGNDTSDFLNCLALLPTRGRTPETTP